ncbi:MAG: hypothetical protein SPL80_09305 [Bacilli bacterium]|nr:hypothetical protein [Bacilli bacterium]
MANDEVRKRARMTFSVIAQLPIEDKEARKAANFVYSCCKRSACKTIEEEEIWDEVFHHAFPLGDEVDVFMRMLEEGFPQA